MNIQPIEKALAGNDRKGFGSNLKLTLDGKFKGFDVFNNTENTEKMQCPKCCPPLTKPVGALKFCTDCEGETKRTAQTFFDNFRRHRQVHKLDRRCYGCESQKTSKMMSKIFPDICRRCADELKTKGATAQNNFIDRATNNFFKGLKKAVQI